MGERECDVLVGHQHMGVSFENGGEKGWGTGVDILRREPMGFGCERTLRGVGLGWSEFKNGFTISIAYEERDGYDVGVGVAGL